MIPYLTYVDYPKLPDHLLLDSETILALPNFKHRGEEIDSLRPSFARSHYFMKLVQPDLKEWLIETFPFKITAYYMIFGELMVPHTDYRAVVYNYIIDEGGDDILTESYSKEYIVRDGGGWTQFRKDAGLITKESSGPLVTITSEKVKKHTWMKLDTTVPHGTTGTITRPRIILSVIPKEAIYLPKTISQIKTLSVIRSVINFRDNW